VRRLGLETLEGRFNFSCVFSFYLTYTNYVVLPRKVKNVSDRWDYPIQTDKRDWAAIFVSAASPKETKTVTLDN
jgi:hypothetical protein